MGIPITGTRKAMVTKLKAKGFTEKIQENDDLRIYRNVYQKLLLRTRRNPSNTKYAREFEFFKDNNNKWRENISKGKCTEKEYIKWLKEQ